MKNKYQIIYKDRFKFNVLYANTERELLLIILSILGQLKDLQISKNKDGAIFEILNSLEIVNLVKGIRI